MTEPRPPRPPTSARMPFPEPLRWLREHGEPADPRPDVDTASLRRRFPRLADVETADDPHRRTARPAVPRACTATRRGAASGRALVWVHGGAFIGGYLDMPESNWVALELAARGIPVFAVDYTKCLGDVHFPVPSDDVLAAWRHARAHAASCSASTPDAVAARRRERGRHADRRCGRAAAGCRRAGARPGWCASIPSSTPTAGASGRDRPGVADGADRAELRRLGRDAADPHVFAGLGRATGFPPTLVVVCEHDGLRPSGEAFAALLADAGVDVQLHLEPGADHAHINEPSDPTALPTIEAIAEWIAHRRPGSHR